MITKFDYLVILSAIIIILASIIQLGNIYSLQPKYTVILAIGMVIVLFFSEMKKLCFKLFSENDITTFIIYY